MAWPATYPERRFNPWPIKYLMPAEKWLPLYWPNEEWEVISFPPAFDNNGNRVAAKPPDGAIIPWWKMPKDQWPIEAPWAGKVFGAWPASQITMSEDLPPSIWPGGHRAPPFGFIKLKMPGTPDVSGYQGPKGNQIPFVNMKIHMRWISPDEMKVKTAITPLGLRYYFQSEGWSQYEFDFKTFQSALRMKRRRRVQQMLAQEIARTRGQPKPTKDLLSFRC